MRNFLIKFLGNFLIVLFLFSPEVMNVKYRIGWPLWSFAYRLGATLTFSYQVEYDKKSDKWFAFSRDIDFIVAEASKLDELFKVVEEEALFWLSKSLGEKVEMSRVVTTRTIYPFVDDIA